MDVLILAAEADANSLEAALAAASYSTTTLNIIGDNSIPLTDELFNEINAADLIVVPWTETTRAGAFAYELGMAAASGKQLIIAVGTERELPDFTRNLPRHNVDFSSLDSVSFFVAHLSELAESVTKSLAAINRLERQHVTAERVIGKLFLDHGYEVNVKNQGVDLLVTDPSTMSVTAVEIKGSGRGVDFKNLRKQAQTARSLSDGFLVVVIDDVGTVRRRSVGDDITVIGLDTLRDKLEQGIHLGELASVALPTA